MTFHVAIPSYGRPDMLAARTLPLLRARAVPPAAVTVFVAAGQADEYRSKVDAEIVAVDYQPGAGPPPHAIGAARNAILRHYPPGSNVVQVDDDIDDLVAATRTGVAPVARIDEFITASFDHATRAGVHLWGTYPSDNPRWLRRGATTGLLFCCGGMFGVRVTGHESETVHLDEKEDYERTLSMFERDGATLRWRGVAAVTHNYSGTGGMVGHRTAASEEESVRWLIARWPNLVHRKRGGKSGYPEVTLRPPSKKSEKTRTDP